MHHAHHLFVIGKIHRRFSREAEGIATLFLPASDLWQQQLGVALIADEVVIYKEDRSSPAQVVQALELSDQLLRILCAWFTSIENDDVAELAIEWTAA